MRMAFVPIFLFLDLLQLEPTKPRWLMMADTGPGGALSGSRCTGQASQALLTPSNPSLTVREVAFGTF